MHALKLPEDPVHRVKRITRRWQEIIIEVTAFAHEQAELEEDEQAKALLADARHWEGRARRQIRKLVKQMAANDA